jgi:large subunit ribosomal protein L25
MTSLLTAQERDTSKASITRSLRKSGKIPAVFYGKTATNQPVSVDEREMVRIFHEVGRNGVIQLQVNDKTYSVMTHDIQYDSLKREFIHLDFLEVDMASKMDVAVPIHFVGEALGAKHGAIVQHHLNELNIRALPNDIPSSIEMDVSELDVGDVLKVKDIKHGSTQEILNDDDDVVVSIIPPQRDRGEEDMDVQKQIEDSIEEHEKAEEE